MALPAHSPLAATPLHYTHHEWLPAGTLVRVPLGQAFPADGQLLGGATRADESLLSGESQPVEKADGAALVAGSVNLGAPVLMRVQRVGADTRFEAIVSMMLGFAFATVGMDSISGNVRLTFGYAELIKGISFLVAVIGLFGLGELLQTMEEGLRFDGIHARIAIRDVFRAIVSLPRLLICT